MRTHSLLSIVTLLFATLTAVADDKPGETKRGKVYDSPEKAYEGYVAAVNEKDAQAAYEALSADCQDFLLFEQWIDELTGKSQATRLSDFIDEVKRRRLTREALPTRRRELPPLLGPAITDRRAAFAALTPTLWRLRNNTVNHYRVGNVKIDGDRATAGLFFKNLNDTSPNGDPLLFQKDAQGWLVDLRPREYSQSAPREEKPKARLREQPATRHASPENAFAAFEEGCRELDATRVWQSVTPEFRNELLFTGRAQLREDHHDSVMLYWYGDLNAFVEADIELDKSVAKRAEAFVKQLHEPVVFLAALLERGRQVEVERGRRASAELTDVQVNGQRARGQVAVNFEAVADQDRAAAKKFPAFTKSVSFQKSSGSWLIDVSSADENQERAKTSSAAPKKERSARFDSPQKVFEACIRARKQFDAATVGECLTEESWNSLIFNAWSEQFHFGSDPPTLHEVIDEARRQELTREKLPIKHEELQPLLMAAIVDRPAALALALHDLDLEGELQEVKVDGEKASAKLLRKKRGGVRITHSLSTHTQFSFSKDEQGWRIDLVNRSGEPDAPPLEQKEPNETEKRIRALEARQPKAWTGEAKPKLDTPQATYLAQREAVLANDSETLWHCMTQDHRQGFMQDKLLMLVESGGGDYILSWYIDLALLKERSGYHLRRSVAAAKKLTQPEEDEAATSPAREARERWSFQQKRAWQQISAGCIYDPPAYFSAIVKRMDLSNRKTRLRYPDAKPSEVTEVRIDGDRALATIKTADFSYQAEFAKVDGAWLIDLESEEEHIVKWRKDEEESRQRREEAEAERKAKEKE